jgi:PAS domain S-box-containing protein
VARVSVYPVGWPGGWLAASLAALPEGRTNTPGADLLDAPALRALFDATRRIAGRADDLDATLEALVEEATEVLPSAAASACLLSPEGGERRRRSSEPATRHTPDRRVTVPIGAEGETAGTLVLEWSGTGAVTADELALAEALAFGAAPAVRVGLLVGAERRGRARHDDAADRLRGLVRAAAAAQFAADEDSVFAALGQAAREAGLSLNVTTLDPTASVLVVRHATIPGVDAGWLRRLLGRPPIGVEIPVDAVPQYRAVVREAQAVFTEDATEWLRAAVPWLPGPALKALKAGLKVDQAMAAPMIDGGRVIGALSVWGPSLASQELPQIELLGRLAGGAVAGLRLRQREQERRAEAERARAELEAIFDAAADPIMVFGPDGRMVRANRQASEVIARRLGRTAETLPELLRMARARGLEVDEPAAVIRRILRGERVDELCKWRPAGGEVQWLQVRGAPVRDEAGRLRAAVMAISDVTRVQVTTTERALLYGAVTTARRVAHELNDHLQLLTSYAELLPEMGQAEARETAGRIADAAQAAGQVVHRLQRIVRFRETNISAGVPALDLEAATASEPHSRG